MKQVRQKRDDLGLALVFGASALTGILWLAGAAAISVSGLVVPHRRPLAGVAALGDPLHPSVAWGAPTGPLVLYWGLTVVFVTAAALVTVAVDRVWSSSFSGQAGKKDSEGMATTREIRQAAGVKPLLARSSTLRPSLDKPRPCEVGYRIGRSRGIECWASVEDSMLLVGPPRSGKGRSVVVPMILDSPGAVVTTSTRPDNLTLTFAARKKRGSVAVFDPQHLARAPSILSSVRWSPIRGCEVPRTALLRAESLVPKSEGAGVENASFWRTQATIAVRCLLHAAAIDGRTINDLYRWSHTAAAAKEAITVLTRESTAAEGWSHALDSIVCADERMRDSTWAMVSNTFASLADPAVRDTLDPSKDESFEPEEFLRGSGSLYLLGTATGATATANLVGALAEDVLDAARHIAASSPEARLDPPLSIILDEAANYPLRSLPSLMSEGGGSGLTVLAVLQSLSQARDKWGRDAASAIWDSAIVKIILGGSANADDLADLSRLIGEREVTEQSHTVSGTTRSVSTSTRSRAVLQPSEIRRIELGRGLLLLRSAPPIMMNLQPWTARADAEELVAGRRRFEAAIRQTHLASPTAQPE